MADKGRFSQPPSAQDDPQRGRIGRVPSRFRTHEARPAEVAERLSRDRVSPSSTGTGHEKSPSPTYPPATQEAASQPPHGYRPTYGRVSCFSFHYIFQLWIFSRLIFLLLVLFSLGPSHPANRPGCTCSRGGGESGTAGGRSEGSQSEGFGCGRGSVGLEFSLNFHSRSTSLVFVSLLCEKWMTFPRYAHVRVPHGVRGAVDIGECSGCGFYRKSVLHVQ